MEPRFRVLFHIEHPYYIPSLEPVIEHFRDNPECALHYTVGKNHSRRLGLFLIRERASLAREVEALGLTTAPEGARFHAVIAADPIPGPERFPGALLVNLDHGPGFKTLRYRNLLKQRPTHYKLFVEGEHRVKMLERYGIHEFCEIFPVGHHKLDPVHRPDYPTREEILSRHGLDPDRPLVLFAPSYKPSCIPFVRGRIADLTPEHQVLIKLHPYSWRGKYAPHWHHRLYRRLTRFHPDIKLIPREDHNVVPYLHAADTLISDASSVILEFLALGKGGVIFRLDQDRQRHSDGEPHLAIDPGQWLHGAFIHCDHVDDLASCVARSLEYDEKRRANVEEWRRHVFASTDGKASQRIYHTVNELLQAQKG